MTKKKKRNATLPWKQVFIRKLLFRLIPLFPLLLHPHTLFLLLEKYKRKKKRARTPREMKKRDFSSPFQAGVAAAKKKKEGPVAAPPERARQSPPQAPTRACRRPCSPAGGGGSGTTAAAAAPCRPAPRGTEEKKKEKTFFSLFFSFSEYAQPPQLPFTLCSESPRPRLFLLFAHLCTLLLRRNAAGFYQKKLEKRFMSTKETNKN